MGFHATINAGQDAFGNTRHKVAPRVRVTEKNAPSQRLTTGRDVRIIIDGVADKYGYMGAGTPVISPYDIASPAFGAKFASESARSIVTRGTWRKDGKVWAISTQRHGTLRVANGLVMLNRDKLGQVDPKLMSSQTGRDMLITMVIAGTVPTEAFEVTRDKAPARERTSDVPRTYVIYAARGERKIRYTVPDDKTPGEIIDDMVDKGYVIVRIANK